jgi:hypothetical protein
MSPAKVQPALLGGVTIGVLSALPVVNCCCCAWILFGGALASYLMQQNHPEPIEVGDGAVAGLLAGVIGAFVWLIVSIPINTVMAPINSELVQQVLRESTDLSPWLRAALEASPSSSGIGLGLVFGFFVMLVLMTTCGMLGGIFGALLFRKHQPPVVPPPIPE